MTIVKKKNCYTVKWSRAKEPDLTWADVKAFCQKQLDKIDTSNEAKEIEHIKTVIKILNSKVNAFEKRKEKYRTMSSLIRDNELTVRLGDEEK